MTDDLRLNVVGWRHLTHSFAVVNQWQLLSLRELAGVQLSVEDAPTLPGWRARPGAFAPEQTARLSELMPPAGAVDVEYRIRFPFDLRAARDGRRVLSFCVSEGGLFADAAFAEGQRFERAAAGLRLVTPSLWSKDRLVENGLDPSRIDVVPHGVDVATFRPDAALRDSFRQRLGIDGFAFLNVSAMVGTKGIALLLAAFATVLENGAKATLILKGNDTLYKSQDNLRSHLNALTEHQRSLVLDHLIYIGQPFDMNAMSGLYNAANAYVSPYHAEGFNMPVLEAAAAGLPLICTGGGATDDFTDDLFRRKIASRRDTRANGDRILVPSLDHLVQLMRDAIDDHDFAQQAKLAGPKHAAVNYNWQRVAEQLVEVARAA